jgi:hypothetical protein
VKQNQKRRKYADTFKSTHSPQNQSAFTSQMQVEEGPDGSQIQQNKKNSRKPPPIVIENMTNYPLMLNPFIIIIIVTGTTALCEPWPSAALLAILSYCRSVPLLLLWISEQPNFYGVRLLSSRAIPSLVDQYIPLRLAPTP